MASRLLQLRRAAAINSASRKLTLLKIVELLEKHGIEPVGNLTNISKKSLLNQSLRSETDDKIKKFADEVLSQPNNAASANQGTNTHIELYESFRSTKVEYFIRDGHFEEAVRVAFLRLNNRVKKLSGIKDDGASLMRGAFSRRSPKLKINSLITREDGDEQEGIMHIFEGSMLAFRNPQSHDDEKKVSPEEAKKILSLANFLMDILDRI